MLDAILGTIEAFFKHGFSWTSLVAIIIMLLRNRHLRKLINNHLPKKFQEQDKLDTINYKLDLLLESEGIQCAENKKSLISTEKIYTESSHKNGLSVHHAKSRIHQKVILNSRGNTFMEKLKSRKFILAVVSAILIILNDGLDLGINSETVMTFAALIATYIFGESAVDFSRKNTTTVKESEFPHDDHAV